MSKPSGLSGLTCRWCGSDKIVGSGATDTGKRKRYRCTECGKRQTQPVGWQNLPELQGEPMLDTSEYLKQLRSAIAGGERHCFVITSAQNATPINKKFFASLITYCQHNGTTLIVIPYRYYNPTSLYSKTLRDMEWWDAAVVPFLLQDRLDLNDNITLLADIKTQPTATSPTSGLETITGSKSAIIGHPKLELVTIPTPQKKLPKIIVTTGAVTKKNYTDTRTGKTGEYHHTFGAAVVEIDGDRFYLRQLNAIRDGSFIDLDKTYTPDGVQGNTQALALVMGDTHVAVIDPDVVNATFDAPDSMVATLKPKYLVWHDLLDFQARNHHTKDNVFITYSQYHAGAVNVEKEIDATLKFVDDHSPPACINIIVPSNHNEAFERWVRECDPKADVENVLFWAKTFQMMLENTEYNQFRIRVPDPFALWAKTKLKCYGRSRFLERDESFSLKGVELAFHGDQGANGSRGNIRGFGKIGVKSIIGHSHVAGVKNGVYQVGTSSSLQLIYNEGPSGWLHAHAVEYQNGKRSLIIIVDGRWRL